MADTPTPNDRRRGRRLVACMALALASALPPAVARAGDPGPKAAADAGASYRVPYRLTATNHVLVRVRINGKGPFNLLVDTGAPALFVSTEAAKKAGLKADPKAFWTPVGRLEVEGGATLRGVKARVDDPYQLVGMNALGLPGAQVDGLLGFTVLARYRIELDPTADRMTWTRLATEPADPPAPRRPPGSRPPAELQAMNMLGGVARIAAALIGRQPEDLRVPRGFVGVELADEPGGAGGVRVARVVPGSPAAEAGVRAGGLLVRVNDTAVRSARDALAAVAAVRPGDTVRLRLRTATGGVENENDEDETSCEVVAGEGL